VGALPLGYDGQVGNWEVLRAGHQYTDDWNQYPLHPGVSTVTGDEASFAALTPAATRAGNTLRLDVTPFSDNDGHLGAGYIFENYPVTGRYSVTADGRQIASGSAVWGVPSVQLGGRASKVSFTLTADAHPPGFLLSPDSRTTWTWRSVRDTSARLPGGWDCFLQRVGPRRYAEVRQCAVQPLLTLDYQIRGLSLSGRTRPGAQVIDLTVGHLRLARAAEVTGATAQVSFDSGRHWRQAAVRRLAGDRFRLSFTAPAGALVSTRVRATDAAGGSITETILRGFAVADRVAGRAALTARVTSARVTSGRVTSARVTSAQAGSAKPVLETACTGQTTDQVACDILFGPEPFSAKPRPIGWGADALERAYHLPVSIDPHQTVAVVSALNTAELATDLATYRTEYGLPACTEASGCLRIVNQDGKAAPLPPSSAHTGWDLEATTDTELISAACPHCQLLVVEASNEGLAELDPATETAARLGAQVILDPYSLTESAAALAYRKAYDLPGHMIVVPAGNGGFSLANFPADLSSVTAVGGTQLSAAKNARGFRETTWNPEEFSLAAGSGCSAFVARPAWQHGADCPGRTVADVSAVAANVAIYNKANGGWLIGAGTSVPAALIAGIYGLAGNAARISVRYLYRHPADFFDITTGDNSLYVSPKILCDDSYLCQAKPGYDAPTGLGTPDGIGGF
jgi:hypothetical protein